MSKEGESKDQHDAGEAGGSSPNKLAALLIPLLNLVAILGTFGFFYYSKFVFKRPKITEESERIRLAQIHASPTPPPQPGLVQFESMTINVHANPEKAITADESSKPLSARLHYLTLAFALEIRDLDRKDIIEGLKPFILDLVNSTVGKKQIQELTNIQGRYVLHSQLIDLINHLITTRTTLYPTEGLVTNVYFTEFIVQ